MAAVVIALAAAVAGFAVSSTDFLLHLLAELVGLIAGGLAGVLVIDRIAESAREEKWRLVAQGTRGTLRSGVVRAVLGLYMLLPPPRPPRGDPVAMEATDSLVEAIERTGRAFEELDPLALRAEPLVALEAVAPHVREIREVVLPRLLLIGGRPEVVRPIVDLEQSFGSLEYDVSLHAAFGLPPAALRDDLVALLRSLRSVAIALDLLV